VLKVDGRKVARQTMEHIMQWDEDFDIGACDQHVEELERHHLAIAHHDLYDNLLQSQPTCPRKSENKRFINRILC
jgi:probable HAF family extracellular repeat protein